MFYLFLDDLREPPDWNVWLVARSVLEAIALVVAEGFPDVISFDHDLGEGPTGMDFAKWLVDYDLDNGLMPDTFSYTIHSANPVGRDNIEGLLNGYLNWKRVHGKNPQTDHECGEPSL